MIKDEGFIAIPLQPSAQATFRSSVKETLYIDIDGITISDYKYSHPDLFFSKPSILKSVYRKILMKIHKQEQAD